MRNLLAFLAAVVLVFASVGWYRGWYRVQSSPARAGHHAVNIDIDKDKIGKDLSEGEEELQKALEKRFKDDGSKRSESAGPDLKPPASTPRPPAEVKLPRTN